MIQYIYGGDVGFDHTPGPMDGFKRAPTLFIA